MWTCGLAGPWRGTRTAACVHACMDTCIYVYGFFLFLRVWFEGKLSFLEGGRVETVHQSLAGELETRVPPALSGQPEAPLSLRGEVEALAARWSDMDGLSVDARILRQESHGATMLSGVGLAVMYAFAGGPL